MNHLPCIEDPPTLVVLTSDAACKKIDISSLDSIKKNPISGQIQFKSSNSFGFFSMKETDVEAEFKTIISLINANLRAKELLLTAYMCDFVYHDGNY